MERVCGCLAILSMLTVRAVVLEYSQLLYIKKTWLFVSLEILKVYCLIWASTSSLCILAFRKIQDSIHKYVNIVVRTNLSYPVFPVSLFPVCIHINTDVVSSQV